MDYRIEEANKKRQNDEIRLTWTLIGMSTLYAIFLAPIYLCSLFEPNVKLNLLCYMLYWLQVNHEHIFSLSYFLCFVVCTELCDLCCQK